MKKQNQQNSNTLKRRDFIGKASATAAAITIVPRHVLGGPGHIAPSDKITVANIGCGTQGLREMGDLLNHPELQVVSVCDCNKYSTDYLDWSPKGIIRGIQKNIGDNSWGKDLKGIPGGRDVGQDYVERFYAKNKPTNKYKGCSSYEDFRELLAKEKDVDVVKIMTPDHTHAPIAIAAMKAGKHVVTHKPIANRMIEGRKTIQVAKDTKVITHLMAWADRPEYDTVFQWIQEGAIGKLKEIHNWSMRPVWPQFNENPTDRPTIPKGFNWDLWLGPVPDRPYHPDYTHMVFRGWYDFGGGSFADMGHYSMLPLFNAFGINKAPISARAYGTTLRGKNTDMPTPKWMKLDVAYPHSAMIKVSFPEQQYIPAFDFYWYDGGMKPFAPPELEADGKDIGTEGMMFVGDKGKIIAGFRCESPSLIPSSRMSDLNKTIPNGPKDRNTNIWVDYVKSGEESPGSFQKAEILTETINLGTIALRAGKKVAYDSANMKITNEEKANKFLTREYREGWEI